MLIYLMEDVNPEQIVGKSMPLLVAYATGASEELSARTVGGRFGRIALFASDQLQVALLKYFQFYEAVHCIDRAKELLEAVPMPWDKAKYEEALLFLANDRLGYYGYPPSSTAFQDTHPEDQAKYRRELKIVQVAHNILTKIPATYPMAGQPPLNIADHYLRQVNTPGINTVLGSMEHYFGLRDNPGMVGIDYEPIRRYRITRDTFLPNAMQELRQLEAVYTEQSETDRQRIEAAFAQSDTITVADRKTVPENLLDHAQYREEEVPDVVASYEDGMTWFRLQTNSCRLEANAMGHCGTGEVLSGAEDQCLISLRRKRNVYIRSEQQMIEMWQPVLTGSYDPPTGRVAELRGNANSKPKSTYHPYIVDLIQKKVFRSFREPSYLPLETFKISDLPVEEVRPLLEVSPGLVPIEDIIFTEKYDIAGEKPPWAKARFEKVLEKGLNDPSIEVVNDGAYWNLHVNANIRYADILTGAIDFAVPGGMNVVDYIRTFMANPAFGNSYNRIPEVIKWILLRFARNPKTKPILTAVVDSLKERGGNAATAAIMMEIIHPKELDDEYVLPLQRIIPVMHQVIMVKACLGSLKDRNEISNYLAIRLAELLELSFKRITSKELHIPDESKLTLSSPIQYNLDLNSLYHERSYGQSMIGAIARQIQNHPRIHKEDGQALIDDLEEQLEKRGKHVKSLQATREEAVLFMATLNNDAETDEQLTVILNKLIDRAIPSD